MVTRHEPKIRVGTLALAGLLLVLSPGRVRARPSSIHVMGALSGQSEPALICRDLLAPVLPGRVLADRYVAGEIFANGQGYRVERQAVVLGSTGLRTTFDYSCTFGALATTPTHVDLVAHEL